MNQVANPMASSAILLECDPNGLIVSMTDASRAVFGSASHLIDAMRSVAPSGSEGLLRLGGAARFTPVFQRGERIWITVELGSGAPDLTLAAAASECAPCTETRTLLNMQNGLLVQYFRLQDAERRLTSRTRLQRPASSKALLQVERERERIGGELHTGVGQTLAAIRLQLETVGSLFADAPPAAQQALNRISDLAAQALDYVRSVARRLHPPEWQRLSLGAALAQLWEMSGVPQRYQGSIEVDVLPREPDLEVKILMYRGAQEALSNLRHSRATRVQLSLRQSGETLVLSIEDNGSGFDPQALFLTPPAWAAGLGLRSIREQAASLGGGLIVQSGPNGTKLELILPFA